MINKEFKYKISLSSKINRIDNENEKQKFISLASKNDNISKLLPKDLDLTKNDGFILFAGEGFVGNLLNANQDGVGSKEAVELAKGIPFTYLDLNHSRTNICGVAVSSNFTDYKTGKELSEDEVKNTKDPFSVTVVGIVWVAPNPKLAEAIENINDSDSPLKDSVYLSWEIAMSDQKLILLDKDNNKFSEGKIISDEKEINKLLPKLLSNGGNGLTEDGKKIGRIPSGEIVMLGFGLVENPAAAVAPIVVEDNKKESTASTTLSDSLIEKLKSLPESGIGYQICDIEMNDGSIIANISIHNCSILSKELNINEIKDIKLSSNASNIKETIEQIIVNTLEKESKENGLLYNSFKNNEKIENKISQAEKVVVNENDNILPNKMKIEKIEQLTDENLKEVGVAGLKEIFASATKDLVDSKIKEISKDYTDKLAEKDKAIEAATKAQEGLNRSIEDINQKLAKASEDLNKVLAENAQRDQLEAFSARMGTIEDQFELDDKQKEIVANKVKTLASDEDFNKYLAEIDVLLAAKKKMKPTKKNPDPDNDGDDDTTKKGDTDKDYAGKDKKEAKASVEDKTAIDAALKNGEKSGEIIPNAGAGAETLTERAKKAFGLDGWEVSNKRKNRI